jgi:acylphosphatase
MNMCIHAWVSGTVQGVYFRDHTRRRAQELQLTGWVKNLPDGRVETLACGPQEAVMQLIDWLWQGSPNAQVSDVRWETVPQQTHADLRSFTIRYD